MKPHDRKPSKKASEAAVRTQLRAKLGWLRGFPTGEAGGAGVPWLVVPRLGSRAAVRSLHVDRELLRSSSYARNSLRRRFPRALPRVVGDVDRWAARVSAQLGTLKACVHEGARVPTLESFERACRSRAVEQALALSRQHPELEAVIRAHAWVHWGNGEGFRSQLGLIAARARELAVLLGQGDALSGVRAFDKLGVSVADRPLLLAVRWLAWVADDPSALYDVVADRRAWTTPTVQGDFSARLGAALKRRANGRNLGSEEVQAGFSRPAAQLAREVVEALFAVPPRDPARRKRVTGLAGLLYGSEQLQAWERWWGVVGEVERATRRLLAQRERGRAFREVLREGQARIKELPEPPAEVFWGRNARALQATCSATREEFAALARAMRALPSTAVGRATRGSLLRSWGEEFRDSTRRPQVIVRVLGVVERLLRHVAAGDPRRAEWVCDGLSGELQDTWQHTPARLAELGRVVGALRPMLDEATEWNRHHGPFADYNGWRHLFEAVVVSDSPKQARALYEARGAKGARVEPESWPLVLRLAGADPARCRVIAHAWSVLSLGEHAVEEVERLCHQPGVDTVLTGAFLDGEPRRLQRLVGWSRLLRALNPPAHRGVWAHRGARDQAGVVQWGRYPAELHPALEELARWEPAAERAADRVLGVNFPDPERVAQELVALRGKLATNPGLAGRIAGLEARLAAPVAVTPARLATCRAKLERRARLARLVNVEDRLLSSLTAALAERCEVVPGGWLADRETLGVVSALAGLKPRSRALGFRLLRTRAGAAPWDLREDPANRAFLERLAALGAEASPWLDGIGPRAIEVPGSASWVIDLEPDPLQILRMGQPFDTCLAPGSFNFFSAVSNAADANKRVLYARDAKGAIRGRCLIALTRAGGLLAFRVYGHERRDLLEAAVRSYTAELAAAVGVPQVPRGHVETLVAHDWYDDGPVDLTGRLAFLDDSDFLRRLPTLGADEIVGALQAANGGQAPTVAVLYVLLQRELLAQQPHLVVPLLPLLPKHSAGLDSWTRLKIVRLLIAAGEQARALELLEPLLDRLPTFGEDEWNATRVHADVAECLIDLGLPHRGLRLLVSRRPKGVRGWRGDYAHRLVAAARATRALHRPRRALELYRLASREGAKRPQAIQELEAELAGEG